MLRAIEAVPTYYENPLREITISNAGEVSLCPEFDHETLKLLDKYLSSVDQKTGLHKETFPIRDIDSDPTIRGYRRGMYSLSSDLRSHLPFIHLPEYLISYLSLKSDQEPAEEESKCSLRCSAEYSKILHYQRFQRNIQRTSIQKFEQIYGSLLSQMHYN